MTHVALVGGGLIGAGWAGRFIENGVDVVVYDPATDAEHRMRETLANAERAWSKLTLATRTRGSVAFAATVEEAVGGAWLVQESAPERLDLKQQLFAEIDRHAPPDALVCSSTSGLRPTALQSAMTRPGRFVVGHPFNPVYLLPLVEIVGGEATSPETIQRACDAYDAVGMRPLVVRSEIDGFIADRLLEALWREALWLVADGHATAAEIDDALAYGAGLRWAQMGTFLTYRIAGGEAGMRHFMAQFGPTLQWPWTKLTDVPELTDELLDRLCDQSDSQAGARTIRELERIRDDNLIAILHGLRSTGWGAGATLAAHERTLVTRRPAATVVDPTRPLRLHECTVDPASVDYNGHMTESRYAEVFMEATDAFLHHAGLDRDYLETTGSFFTVENHVRFLAEAAAGESLAVDTQTLGWDGRKLHLHHTMRRVPDGTGVATLETLLLHVAVGTGAVTASSGTLAEHIAAAADAHAALPLPDGVGRHVGQPRS